MAILATLVCENSCNRAVTEAESNASILNSSVSVTSLLISYGLRTNWRQRLIFLHCVNSRVKIKTQTPSTLNSTSIPGRGKGERTWNRGYVQVVCRITPQGRYFFPITSVKLICHVSKTFLAASRFHSTFKSLDLSAHRLYKSCGPVKTRIVCKAFALKYKETMQLWVVNSQENQNV